MWVAVVVGKAGCGAVDKRVALAAEIRSTISAAATSNVHKVLGSPPMSARLGIASVKQLKLAVDQHRRPRVAPLVIVIDCGVEGVGMMRPQLGFIREKRRGRVPPAGAFFSSGPLWIMLVVGVKDTIFNIESVGVIQSATRRCKVETWAEIHGHRRPTLRICRHQWSAERWLPTRNPQQRASDLLRRRL